MWLIGEGENTRTYVPYLLAHWNGCACNYLLVLANLVLVGVGHGGMRICPERPLGARLRRSAA